MRFNLHFLTIEELEVDERVKELHSKNEIVEQKNRIIQVNSDVITSLQKEVGSLQVRHFCIVICKTNTRSVVRYKLSLGMCFLYNFNLLLLCYCI